MSKRGLLGTLLLLVVSCTGMFAQCINQANGATSSQLICLAPDLYGTSLDTTAHPANFVGGLTLRQTGPAALHFPHFRGASLQSLTALDTAVGTQLSLLPMVTPAAGVSFVFSGGVMTEATTSFGPILGERGGTIGKHRLHLGLMYQRFAFDELDGVSLSHIPTVYQHGGLPAEGPVPPSEAFKNDVISTDNRIDLKVNQWTGVVAYGLTDRIDVSLAIPILDVRMGVSSNARVIKDPGSDAACLALFNTEPCHLFPSGSTSGSYFSTGTASGVGDLILRVKGQVYKGERAALALGTDLRFATGDAKNLLGSGATGVRPFVAMSYRARVTPHLNFGYEWNGSSILGGLITSNGLLSSSRLPNQFFYIAGADVAITRKLSGAADFIGQRVIGATRVFSQTFTTASGVTLPNTIEKHQSYEMDNAAVGLKFAASPRLLFTGNVMFRVDTAGLRAKAVPLVGIGYTF